MLIFEYLIQMAKWPSVMKGRRVKKKDTDKRRRRRRGRRGSVWGEEWGWKALGASRDRGRAGLWCGRDTSWPALSEGPSEADRWKCLLGEKACGCPEGAGLGEEVGTTCASHPGS